MAAVDGCGEGAAAVADACGCKMAASDGDLLRCEASCSAVCLHQSFALALGNFVHACNVVKRNKIDGSV